ncbi:hypothetical protein DEO72_LG8g619 [Vigna unguiculata]|uniref:Uncharacterized protein n=1 Tax=Vigna unguiculata TaxID=3917 RepID=A0A4D6MPA2_VIGUN|nr:hypothetical protein DEO72_LG8g619 [Vigna unguiculata]
MTSVHRSPLSSPTSNHQRNLRRGDTISFTSPPVFVAFHRRFCPNTSPCQGFRWSQPSELRRCSSLISILAPCSNENHHQPVAIPLLEVSATLMLLLSGF